MKKLEQLNYTSIFSFSFPKTENVVGWLESLPDSLQISFWVRFCVLYTIIGNRPLFLSEELSVDFIQEVAAF